MKYASIFYVTPNIIIMPCMLQKFFSLLQGASLIITMFVSMIFPFRMIMYLECDYCWVKCNFVLVIGHLDGLLELSAS